MTSSLWAAEGCQDFGLLALRDLGEVQASSELRCDLIEFRGGDPEIPVGLLKAERRLAGLGRRELVGPTRNVADPQRSHELEAGQPSDAKDGLLSVDLEREVPERLKSRTIEIGATVAKGIQNKTIEASVAAS